MLFLKPGKTPKVGPCERSAADASQTGQSDPADRDARIADLERQLAEERSHATTLRATADSLRFRAEILEKSYATQLADTRAKLAAAERALAEHRAHEATYGSDHEETVRLLAQARSELEQTKRDRDQTRALARRTGWAPPAGQADTSETGERTINELMTGASWLARSEAPTIGLELAAEVAEPDEAPVDMLAPELVFTKD
jgi:chromosome segregation ATPase